MDDSDIALSLALKIEPSGESLDLEQQDHVTRRLLRFLRENDLVAELPLEPGGPAGAKCVGAAEVGKVLLTLLPAAIPKLVELLSHWTNRNANTSVRMKWADGSEIELKGDMAPAELMKLITAAKTTLTPPAATHSPGS